MRGAGRRKVLGWFLEFRLIPVLLWSYTAVSLGTALAYLDRGTIDVGWFAVAMALAGLVQGWETHAINEIYDWRSGTDRDASPRGLSGGSKVRNLNLLDERDLWTVFAASTAAIILLSVLVAVARAPWLVLLIMAAYLLGLVYTLPPVSTAYRPFAGEWFGGFPGVLLAGLGAYGIQTLHFSWTAVAALSAHALVCTAMLVMHHYLDASADAQSRPPKRTAVIVLGPGRARTYATLLAAGGAILYSLFAFAIHPAFAIGAVLTILAVVTHFRVDPEDLRSVTRHELRVIQLGIAAGLAIAVGIAPPLWPLFPLAAIGYLAHLAAVAPPAELAWAWRRTPVEGTTRAQVRGRPK